MNREELGCCWYKKEYELKEFTEGHHISPHKAAEHFFSAGDKSSLCDGR